MSKLAQAGDNNTASPLVANLYDIATASPAELASTIVSTVPLNALMIFLLSTPKQTIAFTFSFTKSTNSS